MFHDMCNFMNITFLIMMALYIIYGPIQTITIFSIVRNVFLVLLTMILMILYLYFYFKFIMSTLQWCIRFFEFSSFDSITPTSSTHMSSTPLVNTNNYHMITKKKTGIFKPWSHHIITVLSTSQFFQALLAIKESRGFKYAAKHPEWLLAMDDEIQALKKNDTWALVPRLKNHNVVGCRYIFKV